MRGLRNTGRFAREKTRRLFLERLRRQERAARTSAEQNQRQIIARERPQDESSPRAKSSGHGKKTADKWNQ